MFFVEAERPALNVREDPAWAYQLRHSSWSATLPLGVLTNFKDFAIYNTRILHGFPGAYPAPYRPPGVAMSDSRMRLASGPPSFGTRACGSVPPVATACAVPRAVENRKSQGAAPNAIASAPLFRHVRLARHHAHRLASHRDRPSHASPSSGPHASQGALTAAVGEAPRVLRARRDFARP